MTCNFLRPSSCLDPWSNPLYGFKMVCQDLSTVATLIKTFFLLVLGTWAKNLVPGGSRFLIYSDTESLVSFMYHLNEVGSVFMFPIFLQGIPFMYVLGCPSNSDFPTDVEDGRYPISEGPAKQHRYQGTPRSLAPRCGEESSKPAACSRSHGMPRRACGRV